MLNGIPQFVPLKSSKTFVNSARNQDSADYFCTTIMKLLIQVQLEIFSRQGHSITQTSSYSPDLAPFDFCFSNNEISHAWNTF